MSLKFFNIRTKEVVVCDTEPKIAALFNSSDKGPNANQGQDFGWRLAPEVVVELRRIRNDPSKISEIAIRFSKPLDEVSETDMLKFISDKTRIEDAPVAIEGDYEYDYQDEIKKLEERDKRKADKAPQKS